VRSVSPAEAAIFLEFELLGSSPLVLGRRIISLLALGTCKCDDVSHFKYPLLFFTAEKSAVIQ